MKERLDLKIVLASDAAEFAAEREELKAFVTSLNEGRGAASYELLDSPGQAPDGGQYFYLLVGGECSDQARESFHQAYERFRQAGTPLLYTYFRRRPGDPPLSASVKAFMTELDEEIGHFFSLYDNLDSVKLGILLELARRSGLAEEVTLMGGKARLAGREVLSLENIPLYRENEDLQRMLALQKELADRFARAAEACAHAPEEEELLAQKEEISRQQLDLFYKLKEKEEDLCRLLQAITERTGLAGGPTAAEKLAIRELEGGHYEEAVQILRRADRSRADLSADQILDADKKVLNGYVSENLLLIRTLMARGVTEERAAEIRAAWEEILRLTKDYGLAPLQAEGYLGYLMQTGEDAYGLEVARILEKIYRIREVSEAEKAELLLTKGILCQSLGLDREAEQYMIQGVKTLREEAEKDPDFLPRLNRACYNLGVLEKEHFGKSEQAARYLREAEEGYQKLCEDDRDRWETSLSMVYSMQGDLYQMERKKSSDRKAAERYEKALEICERRAGEDLMGMGPQLAENSMKYSATCFRQQDTEQAYLWVEKAWKTYDQMARISPVLYTAQADMARERMVAAGMADIQRREKMTQTHLEEIKRLNKQAIRRGVKAKEKKLCLEKALKHCAALEEDGLRALDMADVYANYGNILSGEAAIEYYEKAWEIYREGFTKQPNYCIFSMGKLLKRFGEIGRQAQTSQDWQQQARQASALADAQPEEGLTPEFLADLYGGAGDIFLDSESLREAELAYRKAGKYLLRQKERGSGSEELLQKIRDNEYRLRHLYLSKEPVTIPDIYTEQALDEIIASFPKASAALIRRLPREERYQAVAAGLIKSGEKLLKKGKDRTEAELDFQIARVLFRQLDGHFPGKYLDQIAQIDKNLEQLHSSWQES